VPGVPVKTITSSSVAPAEILNDVVSVNTAVLGTDLAIVNPLALMVPVVPSNVATCSPTKSPV
jgi:hypothetical protein